MRFTYQGLIMLLLLLSGCDWDDSPELALHLAAKQSPGKEICYPFLSPAEAAGFYCLTYKGSPTQQ